MDRRTCGTCRRNCSTCSTAIPAAPATHIQTQLQHLQFCLSVSLSLCLSVSLSLALSHTHKFDGTCSAFCARLTDSAIPMLARRAVKAEVCLSILPRLARRTLNLMPRCRQRHAALITHARTHARTHTHTHTHTHAHAHTHTHALAAPSAAFCVSMCTFVLEKQVKRVPCRFWGRETLAMHVSRLLLTLTLHAPH